MIDKKRIVILTGAGINVQSGIKNAQSPDDFVGMEDRYDGFSDPRFILTNKFFESNPNTQWKFVYDLIENAKQSKPNEAHYAITKFLEYCDR